MWPIIPNIANGRTLINMVNNLLPLFILAVGQMYVLIVAGIDLAQPSIVGLTSVVGAIIMTEAVDKARFGSSPLWGSIIGPDGGPLAGSPMAVPVAILAMLLVGAFIGFLNGFFITRFRMPDFMVTLVFQMLFLYLAIWMTQSFNIVSLPKAFIEIGNGSIGFIPYALIIALIVGVVSYLMLNRSKTGRWLYATGENRSASKISGVPINKVVIKAYVISGICCAIASVIYSGRLRQGSPTMSRNMLMDIIGAAVIGGTSMFGGKGKVGWVLIGCVFFTLLSTVLNMLKLNTFIVDIVKGLFILFAAMFDVIRTRMAASQSTMADDGSLEKAGMENG